MQELIDIHHNGTAYLNILRKMSKVKVEDRSHVDHVDSKIRFDCRSNSPLSPSYTSRKNNEIPGTGSTYLTDGDSINLLDNSCYLARNSHALLMAEERSARAQSIEDDLVEEEKNLLDFLHTSSEIISKRM